MTSITLTRRQSKRILPQVDPPVIEDNDEMRRFSESVKEHLRMYEGDSGAPKERFVTIEELEHVGLVTTKVQSGFASIDKILGEQINAVPSVLPAPGSPGGGGGGGVRTLRALDDTAVDGISGGQGIVFNGIKFVPKEFPNFAVSNATRYDMIYYDGEDWRHTNQELQWNPDDDFMQLANDHSINWLDTAGATQDFINFAALIGGAPGAAVGHIISKLVSGVTTTSATYVAVTGASVPFASMEANEDYAVFVRAYIGNSTSSTTAQNKCQLTKGGSPIGGSEHIYESPTTVIDDQGMLYYWGGTLNSGASGDLQLEHLSGNGSDTVFANNVTIMMIKVDDLILNTNIFHDTDTGLVEIDTGTPWISTGAGVTIGDGASDYLVFGSIRIQDFLTGGNIVSIRVNDGTSTKFGSAVVRGDSSDQLTMGFMQLWQAPAASTTLTVEAQNGMGFPVDKVYASIIAIRLDALADYNSAFLATSPNLGNGPTDIVTLAFTTSGAADYGFISGATGPNSGVTGAPDFIRNDLNGGGDVTIAGSETQFGINNVSSPSDQPHWGVSADQSLGAGDTVDADLNAPDAATPIVWTNCFLVAFQWKLSGDAEFFDVGNVGFTTRMKGLSTRFYDPGLTDFVEFDHDDTDFNITGFQTANINITAITSIQAGTVDVDFDDITATTYGAILEADLVDKSVVETIGGDWTWEGRLVTDDSTTSRAGFNIPIGVAPTSPVQGDIWSTDADLFMELDSVTETNAWISDVDALSFVSRIGHTYAVVDKVKVPSGQKNFIIPFFVSTSGGQTIKLVKARHRINAGTSVTCKLQKNDVDITGFTGITVTQASADTDPTDVTLADNDKLALVVTGISGVPQNLTFSIFIENTV